MNFLIKKYASLGILSPILAVMMGCSPSSGPDSAQPLADLIFVGENIITMEGDEVEAVAVIGDRISAVGDPEDILKMRGDSTRLVELEDSALLPGFIDAHGHFGAVATYSALLDLSSPPVGEMESIDDIIEAIQDWILANDIPEGSLVYAVGYDDSLLLEKRHPNKDDLDRASTTHQVVIRHVSGHLSAAIHWRSKSARLTRILQIRRAG